MTTIILVAMLVLGAIVLTATEIYSIEGLSYKSKKKICPDGPLTEHPLPPFSRLHIESNDLYIGDGDSLIYLRMDPDASVPVITYADGWRRVLSYEVTDSVLRLSFNGEAREVKEGVIEMKFVDNRNMFSPIIITLPEGTVEISSNLWATLHFEGVTADSLAVVNNSGANILMFDRCRIGTLGLSGSTSRVEVSADAGSEIGAVDWRPSHDKPCVYAQEEGHIGALSFFPADSAQDITYSAKGQQRMKICY